MAGRIFSLADVFVVNIQLPLGIAVLVPLNTMGNIGTRSFMASLNAPLRKSPISVVSLRVPSGKKRTDTPLRNHRAASR